MLRYTGGWQPEPTTMLMAYYCYDHARGLAHSEGHVYNSVFTTFGTPASGLDLQALEANGLWG